MQPLSLETGRLQIRWLEFDDADFILRLVNDEQWIRFIGDKGVADLEDARNYIESGPMEMYRKNGFGLNRVALKDSDEAIGICGILQRDSLPEADLGFAFMPDHRRRGYAFEASQAILEHARENLGLAQLVAILTPHNKASASLLTKLGFGLAHNYRAQADSEILDLYSIDLKNR